MSLYIDFDSKFRGHPVKKDLFLVTDSQSVANSIKMIVMTNFYERPFNSQFGGNLSGLLFELADEDAAGTVKERIKFTLQKWEPRAQIEDIQSVTIGDHELQVSVFFRLLNKTEVNRTDITLRVAR